MDIGPVEVVVLLIVLVLPIYVGYRVGKVRGQAVLGLVLGFMLSWLGVLIVLLMPKRATTPA
jgi:hypothetical protein